MNIAKQHEILAMVRNQLQRTNPPSTEALYGRAIRIDESIRELSLRQFNARYPLQVHREMARGEKKEEEATSSATPEAPEPRGPGPDHGVRPALRQLLHDVARDVAGLSTGPELVDWVEGRLDDYVDRATATVRRDGTERR